MVNNYYPILHHCCLGMWWIIIIQFFTIAVWECGEYYYLILHHCCLGMWWIAVEDLDQASGPAQLLLLGWKYTIIGQVQSHVGWSRATWAGLYISHHQLVHGSMIPPSYRLTQSCQCPPVIGWQCFHPPVIGQLCYHIPVIGQCVTI